MFAGSGGDGVRAAAFNSPIGTAEFNDLDHETYLRFVLERLADYPVNRIAEWLPWNVASQLVLPERLGA